MTKEKQIEEMAKDIERTGMLDSYSRCEVVAEELYNADWRKHTDRRFLVKENGELIPLSPKQSEGEWKKKYDKAPRYVCSVCNHLYNNKEFKYCPNCGAKMKGGAE